MTMTYLVAMKDDILKSVEIKVNDIDGYTYNATMEFTCLQDISQLPPEWKEPQIAPTTSPVLPDNGIRWLIDLANHTLGVQ